MTRLFNDLLIATSQLMMLTFAIYCACGVAHLPIDPMFIFVVLSFITFAMHLPNERQIKPTEHSYAQFRSVDRALRPYRNKFR